MPALKKAGCIIKFKNVPFCFYIDRDKKFDFLSISF